VDRKLPATQPTTGAEVSKSQQKVSTEKQQNATGNLDLPWCKTCKNLTFSDPQSQQNVNKKSTANCGNDLAVSISGIQRGIHGIVGYQGFGYQAWLPRKHDFESPTVTKKSPAF
jgi:hypothetical protein